jgi:polyisoprenoid-binding protein YceI
MSTITETRETLPTGTWSVDPVHSQVGFAVDYMVGTFRGSFSPIEAKLEVGPDGSATLTGVVPVAGVKVQDENLTAHLQSPEFFDAERSPEISFTSTAIRRSDDELAIAGDLTIKGLTLPVEAKGTITEPVDDPHGGVRFGLKLETVIDRTTFGIRWNNQLPNGELALASAVVLTADLYLVKQ